ncbi:MAG: HEAT repeat domain-containing protein [Phycisphaerae bacterium]
MLSAVFCVSAVRAQDAATLVAKFPPKTNAEEPALAAELMKLGPAGIKDVCAMLVPLDAEKAKDDTAARFALVALERHAGRPGGDAADRRTFTAAICDALTTRAEPEIRAFLIERLKWAGDESAVGPVAAYLSDESLAPHAAAALARIRTPDAVAALEKALPGSDKGARVAIVKALGDLRAAGQAEELRKSAASADATLRLTALYALANVGDAQARELLDKAEQSAGGAYEKSRVTSARLLLIERRFSKANDESVAAARELIRTYSDAKDVNVAIAALRLLARGNPDAAAAPIAAAVDSPRAELRNGALDAAGLIRGLGGTAPLLDKLRAAGTPPAVKADVLAYLGRRGERSPPVQTLVGEVIADAKEDPAVRLAAVTALPRLVAGELAVEPIARFVQTAPAAQAKPAAEVLMRVPGDAPVRALAAALATAAPANKLVIIEALATRADPAAPTAGPLKDAVLAQLASTDPGVPAAAAKAMEKLAAPADAPKLIDLAMSASAENVEQGALRAAVAAVAQSTGDAKTEPFLAALAKAPPAKRAALHKALAKLAGPKALAAVAADLKSDDAAVKDGAIRALADWADESAAAPLLDVAAGNHAAKPNQQVLAVRGVITLARNSKSDSAEKVKLLAQALKAATRPDEKKLALAALSSERTTTALDLAAGLLDDEALRPEAALAVVKIAAPTEKGQKGLTGPTVAAALKKALPHCPDATAKQAGEKYLKTLK